MRILRVEGREIRTGSGCAADVFAHAAVLDVPFSVEDTCAATGAPIRIELAPVGLERARPPAAVAAVLPPELIPGHAGTGAGQINANVCVYQPFFASAAAASDWLSNHLGGRVFTAEEMFQRPIYSYYRDTLRPLIHTTART